MGEREKILLVDDTISITNSFKRLFELYGHEVVGTINSVNALVTFLENDQGNISVAVVDNRMPNDGDGEKAAALIRQAIPGITIISYAFDLQKWGDINIKKSEGGGALLNKIQNL